MSGRVSLIRWTSHPAVTVANFVFVMRDVVLTALAIGAIATGVLAHEDTLSIVAVVLGGLALTGVIASSVIGQRRMAGVGARPSTSAGPYPGTGRTQRGAPVTAHPPREEPVTQPGTVADQVRIGAQLRDEIHSTQARGAWDEEGWAYRKRVEEWTQRTARVLADCDRPDLARALDEVEVPPRPPFESLLNGHSPSYTRLVGLLDGRLGLLEQSRA